MLQIMRTLSKSWVAKALMILLIVSFGIWGIGDMFRGNAMERTVAKVGKIVITRQTVEREFERALPEARRVFGADLTAPKARMLGVLERTLIGLTENLKFDLEVKRLGINVGDEIILAKLAAQPELRDKDGHFNTQLWREALARGGYTERSFIDSERKSDARHLLLETLINDVKAPKIMTDSLYSARGAKRILEVLTLDNAGMTDVPQPDDAALEDFHKEHGDMFSVPEYRALTIVRLATDDVSKDISITEDDLKKAYESRKGEFAHPEQRDYVQVLFQDEAKAKSFATAVKAGGNLVATAKAQGLSPIDLNRVDEKSILQELYAPLFAMEDGQISDALKSSLGWHVVQQKKVYPAGTPSFEEARDKLSETMMREQAADAVARTVNQLDDSLAAARSLEDVADTLKLRMIKIPAVDTDGKTPDGKDPGELPAREELLPAAFGLNAGETSQVIDDKKGNYYVVRVDDVNAAHVEAFDKVKDKVVEAWRKQKQAEQAAAEAETMAQAIRDGKKTTSFAGRKGVEVWLSKPISLLGDIDTNVPASSMANVFQMKKDDVITATGPDRQYILRLADIAAVDPAHPDDTRLKVVKDIDDKLPYELIDEYSTFLNLRFPVKVDQELLDTMKKQGT